MVQNNEKVVDCIDRWKASNKSYFQRTVYHLCIELKKKCMGFVESREIIAYSMFL